MATGLSGINTTSGQIREDERLKQWKESIDRQLETERKRKEENEKFRQSISRSEVRAYVNRPNRSLPSQISAPLGFGESRLDYEIINPYELMDLNEARARRQSDAEKIFNGVAKGVITMGTTFANGLLGMPLGLVEMGVGYVSDWITGGNGVYENPLERMSGNEITSLSQEINKSSEEFLPNYYSKDESEHPWEHVFSANFIGDKFIKNLGFTYGALAAGTTGGIGKILTNTIGGTISKGWSASKAIAELSGNPNIGNVIRGIYGVGMASINEASIESYNNAEDFINDNVNKIYDTYNSRVLSIQNDVRAGLTSEADAQLLIAKEEEKFNKAMNRLFEDKAKVANASFLANTALLAITEGFQFYRPLANGFGTARRLSNVVRRMENGAIRYEIPAGSILTGGLAYGIGDMVFEGGQEITQSYIGSASKDYYNQDVMNFYRSQIDPNYTQQSVSLLKTLASAFNKTWNDQNAWEEFFIGALTGGMGIVQVGNNARNADFKIGDNFGITGGIIGEVSNARKEKARQQKVIDMANEALQSDPTKTSLRFLNQYIANQNVMDLAAVAGDKKTYKDAEFEQMINYIIASDAIGHLWDYKQHIKDFWGDDKLTDEFINKLRQETINTETGHGPLTDKYNDNEEARKVLKENRDNILTAIDRYNKIKNDLDIRTKNVLSADQLAHLTWLQSKLDNWNERERELSKTTIETLEKLKNSVYNGEFKNWLELEEVVAGAMKKSGLTQNYNAIMEKIKAAKTDKDSVIKNIDDLIDFLKNSALVSASILDLNVTNKSGSTEVAKHVPLVLALSAIFDQLQKDISSGALHAMETGTKEAIDIIKDAQQNLIDLHSMHNDVIAFNDALMKYLENPKALDEDREKAESDIRDADSDKKIDETEKRIKEAKDAKGRYEIYSSLSEEEKRKYNEKYHNNPYQFKEKLIKTFKEVVNKLTAYDDYYKQKAIEVYTGIVINAQERDNAALLFGSIANPQTVGLWNRVEMVVKSIHSDPMVQYGIAQCISDALMTIHNAKEFKDNFLHFVGNPLPSPLNPPNPIVQPAGNDPAHGEGVTVTTGNAISDDLDGYGSPDKSGLSVLPLPDTDPKVTQNQGDPQYIRSGISEYDIDKAKSNTREYIEFWEQNMYENLQKAGLTLDEAKAYIEEIKKTDWQQLPAQNTEEYKKRTQATKENIENKTYRGFYDIYKFIQEKGGFDYVNKGSLKVGDKVQLCIIPEFSEDIVFILKGDQVINILSGSKDFDHIRKYCIERYNSIKKAGKSRALEEIAFNSQQFHLKDDKSYANRYVDESGHEYVRLHYLLDNLPNGRESSSKEGTPLNNEALTRGSRVDAFLRIIIKGIFDNEDTTSLLSRAKKEANDDLIGDQYKYSNDYYEKLFKNIKEIIDKYIQDGFNLLSENTTLATNINGLNIAGTADLLLEKNGKVYVVDFKTDANGQPKARYRAQLWFYCKCLLDAGYEVGVKPQLWFIDKNEGGGNITAQTVNINLDPNANGEDKNEWTLNSKGTFVYGNDSTFSLLDSIEAQKIADGSVSPTVSENRPNNIVSAGSRFSNEEIDEKIPVKVARSTVAHLYNGTVLYTNKDDERNLLDIIGNDEPIFGIVDGNGKIYTGKKQYNIRIKGSNIAINYPKGTPVILVKDSLGYYFPLPFRTSREKLAETIISTIFNGEITEDNVSNILNKDKLNELQGLAKDVAMLISQVLQATTYEGFKKACLGYFDNTANKHVNGLKDYLLGVNIYFDAATRIEGKRQKIMSANNNDAPNTPVYSLGIVDRTNPDPEQPDTQYFDIRNEDGSVNKDQMVSFIQNLISDRSAIKLNVSKFKINTDGYNRALAEFCLINVKSFDIHQSYFDLNPVNEKGKELTANPDLPPISNNPPTPPNVGPIPPTTNPIIPIIPNIPIPPSGPNLGGDPEVTFNTNRNLLNEIVQDRWKSLANLVKTLGIVPKTNLERELFSNREDIEAIYITEDGSKIGIKRKSNKEIKEYDFTDADKVAFENLRKPVDSDIPTEAVNGEAIQDIESQNQGGFQSAPLVQPTSDEPQGTGGPIKPFDNQNDNLFLLSSQTERTERIDINNEVEWIRKHLPQIPIQVIDDLIRSATNGSYAYGQFKNAMITLSRLGVAGTGYHEAFHAVFELLLSDEEKEKLYYEASELYGKREKRLFGDSATREHLQEMLAERFAEYTLNRTAKNTFGKRVKNFFSRLFNLISGYRKYSNEMDIIFRRINEGYYANSTIRKHGNFKEDGSIKSLRELKRESGEYYLLYNTLPEEKREYVDSTYGKEIWDKFPTEIKENILHCRF